MRLRSRHTLRALMAQEEISMGQLADAADVHRSFVSHLVSGRSTGATEIVAERIAKVLCVPVEVLFDDRSVEPGRRPEVERQLGRPGGNKGQLGRNIEGGK